MSDSAPLLEVFVPGIVLVTLTNQRERWWAAWKRSKAHRGPTKLLVTNALSKAPAHVRDLVSRLKAPEAWGRIGWDPNGAALVKITRIFEGSLDHDDNLNTSAKHVRDGVADALGIDDGTSRVSWRYAQRPTSPGWGVGALVQIYARGECRCCGQYRIAER